MAIGITNAGGVNAWAMVLVNYPSGSTLTATNVSGKKDISATQRLYYVKKPSSGSTQTCDFTITDGTRTKTKTISGITVGTAQTITLSYAFILFADGEYGSLGSFVNVGTGGYSTLSISNNKLVLYTRGVLGGTNKRGAFTQSAVDCSNYNTLHAIIQYTTGAGYAYGAQRVGLMSGSPSSSNYLPNIGYYHIPDAGIYTINLDISSFNNSYYIGFSEMNRDSEADVYAYLTELWLE